MANKRNEQPSRVKRRSSDKNGLDRLSRMSALSESTIKRIAFDVIENNKRLNSCCGPHDFSHKSNSTPPIRTTQWQCSKCGGAVTTINKMWYEKGMSDGIKEAYKNNNQKH